MAIAWPVRVMPDRGSGERRARAGAITTAVMVHRESASMGKCND